MATSPGRLNEFRYTFSPQAPPHLRNPQSHSTICRPTPWCYAVLMGSQVEFNDLKKKLKANAVHGFSVFQFPLSNLTDIDWFQPSCLHDCPVWKEICNLLYSFYANTYQKQFSKNALSFNEMLIHPLGKESERIRKTWENLDIPMRFVQNLPQFLQIISNPQLLLSSSVSTMLCVLRFSLMHLETFWSMAQASVLHLALCHSGDGISSALRPTPTPHAANNLAVSGKRRGTTTARRILLDCSGRRISFHFQFIKNQEVLWDVVPASKWIP